MPNNFLISKEETVEENGIFIACARVCKGGVIHFAEDGEAEATVVPIKATGNSKEEAEANLTTKLEENGIE